MNPHTLATKDKEKYFKTFSELYEHSPWVIEDSFKEVKENDIYNNLQIFHKLLSQIVLNSPKKLQDTLIKSHPMLAGKKALENKLTDFSSNEQKSAGLNNCTQEEMQNFNDLNKAYFEEFGFPFIMAIKGVSKEEIIKKFKHRIKNSISEERIEALKQINKIALIRIKDIYGE